MHYDLEKINKARAAKGAPPLTDKQAGEVLMQTPEPHGHPRDNDKLLIEHVVKQ
jgi:hypothetical protein